jgi:hypothetical protein
MSHFQRHKKNLYAFAVQGWPAQQNLSQLFGNLPLKTIFALRFAKPVPKYQ